MRLSVFDFARDVGRRIGALSRDELILRRGPAKRLLEELLPISQFSLQLGGGDVTQVEAYENDGPLDATIYWRASDSNGLNVEVTFVYSYEDALRDELMWSQGWTPGTGPIRRDKSAGQIVAENKLVPIPERMAVVGSAIVDRFRKKCEKGYPKGTLLLLAFEDPTFFGFNAWRELFDAIDSRGGLNGGFGEVYIVNTGSHEVQGVM